ncbi:DUF3619 family protein [Burkholderia glumae]|uniref:DUF3619 family protein n=2 Tax=Burkholderia glumae TaxID=337 RepID=A0AAQ0BUB2_BURGL|nr:DUF3619 family protein [Burkholderia glumae]ACR29686.1 Hypothetical protein bglu_1g26100 [Burkholderia glumae BGR1]AJY68038.1 hypothetical protein KS03_54 [Burkholderia glumae LMG 2196 = ATCC 33617]KHJ63159.1 membrane protein [Burkholderia glumae]MCM2482645.1 DUF3619 family protein [Burkholderia glumae]MCM2490707.1 DUF3619 family protein [Burkholderia glumae]
MSSAPELKELEFALKVRRALDERAASLPQPAADRLAAARRAALARKKPDAGVVLVPALAGAVSSGLGRAHGPAPRPVSLARRIARALPLAVLLAGIAGIAYWENQQHTAELADIDAAMLSDNLPLNAYLDHGFNAYLSHTR